MLKRLISRRAACGATLAGLGWLAAGAAWSRGLPPQTPTIYVADFELDAADIKSETVLPRVLPGRPRLLPEGPLGVRHDPQAQARHLVDLMARSVVDELTKAGFSTQRLPSTSVLPGSGWLVRGVFLQVDEGNRLRRAVIGFGAGHTDLQVAATADDLSRGRPAPLYDVDAQARSGHLPGAAVTLNPVVAGARFVLAGSDLDRNVRACAAKIAQAVATRVHGPQNSSPQ